MATYYSTSSSQSDVFPSAYFLSQKPDSYPESPRPPDNIMYQNQSFSELLSGSSLPPHSCVNVSSIGGRDELPFIPPTTNNLDMQSISGAQMLSREKHHSLDGEHDLQYQELSLRLGMQIPSSMELPAFPYEYKNPGSFYLMSSHQSDPGERPSQSKEFEASEYLSFDLAGSAENTSKIRPNNPQCSISSEQMQPIPDTYEPSGFVAKIYNSRYLKPAQQFLDEVVNLREALRQLKMNRHNFHKLGSNGSEENGSKFDPHESTTSSSAELSPSERQDLQSKISKLLPMLDEVDRRYREYYHQMQMVESTFEMVAGCGAARPYTALALQTISRHFRCLRDTVIRQIRETRRRLGEQDDSPGSQVLPRLRYVDKQLRQQRTLQQLGMPRHSWRPQRGLPEGSVSILRAWLFEHFLNPYPKDSEKITLARQTGLSRSQIANWFINARVRLWKPMVEDMYKEEFGDSEVNCRSSPELVEPKAAKEKSLSSEDRAKELQTSVTSTAFAGGPIRQFGDSNPDIINNIRGDGYKTSQVFQNGAHKDNAIDYRASNLQLQPKVDDSDLVDEYRFGDPHLVHDFVA